MQVYTTWGKVKMKQGMNGRDDGCHGNGFRTLLRLRPLEIPHEKKDSNVCAIFSYLRYNGDDPVRKLLINVVNVEEAAVISGPTKYRMIFILRS